MKKLLFILMLALFLIVTAVCVGGNFTSKQLALHVENNLSLTSKQIIDSNDTELWAIIPSYQGTRVLFCNGARMARKAAILLENARIKGEVKALMQNYLDTNFPDYTVTFRMENGNRIIEFNLDGS